jgi:LppX_LprAFG lipoprotein
MRRLPWLLVAVALAGCGGSGKPAGPSAASLLQRTVAATGAQETFHFRLDVANPATSASGLNLTFAEGDAIVPDRVKASVAGTYNGIPLTSRIVFAGSRRFLVNPLSGKWQSFSTKTSPVRFFSPGTGVLTAIKGATGLQLAGTEQVGGVETYKLVGKVKARSLSRFLGNPPSDMEADAEIDVGKDDHLLRKLRLTGPIAAGEPDDISRTIVLSRFGEQVAIEAPAAG